VSELLRRTAALIAALIVCSLGGACARPLGDFGRPRDGFANDRLLHSAHGLRARTAGGPHSEFIVTDAEREMHDRIWRFLVAPHAGGWFMHVRGERPQPAFAPAIDDAGGRPDRYYRWISGRGYASSHVRFRTIADDAKTDSQTAAATFAAICDVLEIDRQRETASRGLDELAAEDVAGRRAENRISILGFARALEYRSASYGYALDHLLVETPHPEAIDADAQVSGLAIYADRAQRFDFCVDMTGGLEGGALASPVRLGPTVGR
jgi:hypothetical protein